MHTQRFALVSVAIVMVLVLAETASAFAATPLGTTFTYQGRLTQSANPVNGNADFQLSLWDGSGAGSAMVTPFMLRTAAVVDGTFTLDLNFGPQMFTGNERWLEIGVRFPAGGGGSFTTLTPRQRINAAPYALALPGLYSFMNVDSPNLVGGYSGNSIVPNPSLVIGATISGGGIDGSVNSVNGDFGTIGGGQGNSAGYHCVVGGGDFNIASSEAPASGNATIGGGSENQATQYASTVAGGSSNTAVGVYSFVGGGIQNTASNFAATVAGGFGNAASGQNSHIGGGKSNIANNQMAVVGGGEQNTAGQAHATVGGGKLNNVTGSFSTIGGGSGNSIPSGSSTIGGGRSNTIGGGGDCTIAGGSSNLTGGGGACTIGGGTGNSTAGGGGGCTIAGGSTNSITGGSGGGFIGGGDFNSINSSGGDAVVAGGVFNTASNASATVGGGSSNTASGSNATVPGGSLNLAQGSFSFACGRRAKALASGTFVWADSSNADYSVGGANRFCVRASGGAEIFTNAGITTGVFLSAGSGSWSSVSDRAVKSNIHPVDPADALHKVLSMPISTWNYTSQEESIRHIGPMAQDFFAAFGVGEDDRHITSIDADGAALAAIQGLHQGLQQALEKRDAEISQLRETAAGQAAELAQLKAQLEALRALLESRAKPERTAASTSE